MSNKLYVLRLEAGFPAESRRRAGIYLVKGERLTTELTKEQLEAVQNDEWIKVKEADASVTTEDTELDIEKLGRKDLDLIAVELGLDPSDFKNLETLRPAVKEAIAKREAGETTPPKDPQGDETEEVDLTTNSIDELELIAVELSLNVEKVEDEAEYKAALIKAIEDAKPVEE